MTEMFQLRQISLHRIGELEDLKAFLHSHHLRYEDDIQAAFGIFDTEETLVGCGCASGCLLKCFAVEEVLRGQNVLGALITALTQNRFTAGYYDLFVITRRHNEPLFSGCGFFPLVRTDELVMLENRPDGPQVFAAELCRPEDAGKQAGSIVMNCNPFTLGHRALIEYAAGHCDILHVFVVEEDRSLFPADIRFRLVKEGTEDLPNVRVHLSGHYMISAATFPTYFLKADEDAAVLQSELDVTLFAQRIAPLFHITKRFAGQEPLDPITAHYNETMRKILPEYGIAFCEIPRVKIAGRTVSASYVRQLLQDRNQYTEAFRFLPECTKRYLAEAGGAL